MAAMTQFPQISLFRKLAGKAGLCSAAVVTIAALGSATALAQSLTGTTLPAPTLTLHAEPATVPAAAAPGAATEPATPATPAVPATPTAAAPATTHEFVGEVSHDHVYVRSGPGVNYYELGQLNRGDNIEVVGSKSGWYLIDPPVGTLCYVAKELVDVDAGGQTGTVKGDFVNIRAASLIHPFSDGVVLTVAKKGTKVTIQGSSDKYYKITPPDGVHVYISTQLVAPAPAGTQYSTPTLKLPTNYSTEPTTPAVAATNPAVPGVAATQSAPGPLTIEVTPQPAVAINSAARSKFTEVNDRTQAEFVKPILAENLEGLIADYKAILAMPDVPPSVQQSCQERIGLVQKRLDLQNIAKEAAAPEPPAAIAERQALEQTWEQSQKQIAAAELVAPYAAQGQLRTSEALHSKYVLVNPSTNRVVAYVDPESEIDISPLLGHYVGVKGKVEMTDGIKLIHVETATLMSEPKQMTPGE